MPGPSSPLFLLPQGSSILQGEASWGVGVGRGQKEGRGGPWAGQGCQGRREGAIFVLPWSTGKYKYDLEDGLRFFPGEWDRPLTPQLGVHLTPAHIVETPALCSQLSLGSTAGGQNPLLTLPTCQLLTRPASSLACCHPDSALTNPHSPGFEGPLGCRGAGGLPIAPPQPRLSVGCRLQMGPISVCPLSGGASCSHSCSPFLTPPPCRQLG